MPEAHKRAYRHPKYKTSYRVKNWPEYEKSLRNRGDITVWLSRNAVDAWTPPKNGKRGGQPIYSDIAIETSPSITPGGRIPQIHPKTYGFVSALPKSHDRVPSESNGKYPQACQGLVGRPFELYRRQHRFEDLRLGRMARQEAWGKVAQTLEETAPWRG
ncbi:hypothetical protein ES703_69843 [subsurface metagenome]